MRILKLLLWLVLCGVFAAAFYERYGRWRGCFNELGRCYDSRAGVMVEQAGGIWGALTVACALLFLKDVWQAIRR